MSLASAVKLTSSAQQPHLTNKYNNTKKEEKNECNSGQKQMLWGFSAMVNACVAYS